MATSEETKRLGRAIKTLRLDAEMSQDDLAMATGIAQSGIGRLETGQTEMPLWKLALIAEFFGCSLGALIDGTTGSTAGLIVRIAISAEVTCVTHGVIGTGLSDVDARALRISHLREHAAERGN